MFLIDVSSSVGNTKLNQAGMFDCFKGLMASTLESFRRRLHESKINVAAVTFGSSASVLFDFDDYHANRTAMIEKLRTLEYPDYGTEETFADIHLALKEVRETLARPASGWLDFRRPLVLVPLTSGYLRADAPRYAGGVCEGVPDQKECAIKLVADEFANFAASEHAAVRDASSLVYSTPPLARTLPAGVLATQARALGAIIANAGIYSDWLPAPGGAVLQACSVPHREVLSRAVLESEALCLNPPTPSSTATSSVSSTPSRTASTTATVVSYSFHAPMCPGTEPAPTPLAALITEPAFRIVLN